MSDVEARRERWEELRERRGALKAQAYGMLYGHPDFDREKFDTVWKQIRELGEEMYSLLEDHVEGLWHITTDSGFCTCGEEHHESNESDS